MELRDPVVVYIAASNVEAQVVKILLTEAEVEACVSEDFSTGGLWMFGTLSEIHRPQVWVSQHDYARARQLLQDYERRVAERNRPNREEQPDAEAAINVTCEECNQQSSFPASQRGTIQDCPRCGAYVDVGDIDENQIWAEPDEPEAP